MIRALDSYTDVAVCFSAGQHAGNTEKPGRRIEEPEVTDGAGIWRGGGQSHGLQSVPHWIIVPSSDELCFNLIRHKQR